FFSWIPGFPIKPSHWRLRQTPCNSCVPAFLILSGLNPTAHFALVLQIRLTEFCGEISLFTKDYAVLKNNNDRHDEEQRDPVVEKEAECDLQQTKGQIHRVTGEAKRPATHKR